MIGISDFQDLLAGAFFDGNTAIAGIIIYAVVMCVIFAATRNITHSLLISLPITLVFSMLGMLTTDVMMLLIIVTVLGLAYATKDTWRT